MMGKNNTDSIDNFISLIDSLKKKIYSERNLDLEVLIRKIINKLLAITGYTIPIRMSQKPISELGGINGN